MNIQPPVEKIEQPKPEEETRKQPAKVKGKTELRKKTNKPKPQQKRTITAAPLAKMSLGLTSPKIELRATSSADLSEAAVKQMMAEMGFYDSEWNENGQGFANQFAPVERQGESLIIDENSGLTWQQSGSDEEMLFKDVQKYIRSLNHQKFASYNNWRLPTLEEAMSLMEPTKNKDGLNINPIFDSEQMWIWTADKETASRAWHVHFYVGNCVFGGGIGSYAHVRSVR